MSHLRRWLLASAFAFIGCGGQVPDDGLPGGGDSGAVEASRDGQAADESDGLGFATAISFRPVMGPRMLPLTYGLEHPRSDRRVIESSPSHGTSAALRGVNVGTTSAGVVWAGVASSSTVTVTSTR